MPARWERVVCLSFSERLGQAASRSLWHEVQGRYSNLILTMAESGTILAAGHQVTWGALALVHPVFTPSTVCVFVMLLSFFLSSSTLW